VSRVLVVDDDLGLARALSINLRARGYQVDLAGTGHAALRSAAQHHPDIVVLDLGLPDLDGLDVITGLRGWTTVPILVLSARDAEHDKVAALDAGADDMLTKPFGMNELLARLRAGLRRAAPTTEQAVIITSAFTVDLAAKQVTTPAGRPIRVTATEWHLLACLVRHADHVVSHAELLQQVWGPGYDTQHQYLRVHLAALRRKLEPEPARPRYLVTDTGMGYRFRSESVEDAR
jgi:two-component system KDP operon response regulator KdpE